MREKKKKTKHFFTHSVVERWKESKSNRADTAALAEIRLRSYSNPMAWQENKKKRTALKNKVSRTHKQVYSFTRSKRRRTETLKSKYFSFIADLAILSSNST
jgi:hypothetical protein